MSATPRRAAPWMNGNVPALHRAVAVRALQDVGVCEVPLGTNRGPRVDEYVSAAGSPLGSPWCAAALAAWWRECGATTPGKYKDGSCDEWMKWAKDRGQWRSHPQTGYAVVYGVPGDANHVGQVIRTSPLLLSVEGNTSMDRHNREGLIVAAKQIDTKRVLGYIEPTLQNARLK